MPFDLDIGGGQIATVNAPVRDAFSDNLGGALQFALANAVYKVTEVMGGALGAFGGGMLVQFLDRIEPSLVQYARPMIDLILDLDDLDPRIREFFQQLRDPVDAGGAAVLAGLSSQVGGAVMGNVLAPFLAKATYTLNRAFRPALLGVAELITGYRRHELSLDEARYFLSMHGFSEKAIDLLLVVTKAKAGVGDLITAAFRNEIPFERFVAKMGEFGFEPEDINIIVTAAQAKPGVSEIMVGWFRGELTDQGVSDRLGGLGYDGNDIHYLKSIARPIPGPGDLVRMSVREAFNDDVAQALGYDEAFPPDFERYMRMQGFDPLWSKYFWRAHWVLPGVSQAFEMFHRGFIDGGQLDDFLKTSDIPSFWRARLTEIAYRPLTRVDVRRMYGHGVLDREQVKQSYLDLGYNDQNAERMTEFTILYEEARGESKTAEYRDLTRSVVVSAFRKGVIARDQAVTRLMDLGFEAEDIELLLALAEWQEEIDTTPDYSEDYARDMKRLIERAYAQRVISMSDAQTILADAGISENESAYILALVDFWYGLEQSDEELKTVGDAYIRRGIHRSEALSKLAAFGIPAEMIALKMAEWETQRNIRSRRLTESQYRKALREGVITKNEYCENLRGLGYTDYDVHVLTALAVGVDEAGPPPDTGPLAIGDR